VRNTIVPLRQTQQQHSCTQLGPDAMTLSHQQTAQACCLASTTAGARVAAAAAALLLLATLLLLLQPHCSWKHMLVLYGSQTAALVFDSSGLDHP
jgi:hypothetical protein